MKISLKVGRNHRIREIGVAFPRQKKESVFDKGDKVRGEDRFHELGRERVGQAEEPLSIFLILVEIGSVEFKYLLKIGKIQKGLNVFSSLFNGSGKREWMKPETIPDLFEMT